MVCVVNPLPKFLLFFFLSLDYASSKSWNTEKQSHQDLYSCNQATRLLQQQSGHPDLYNNNQVTGTLQQQSGHRDLYNSKQVTGTLQQQSGHQDLYSINQITKIFTTGIGSSRRPVKSQRPLEEHQDAKTSPLRLLQT
ncbi:hypothetical protein H6P81_002538 [Aristolochia fimbriata]|uniref:Uncharacterized protein n=1 Tax=Aristolochia fimbriata TaxID=158543 RepID=A0AAV7FA23_ARIFI|nr:hypothetical protein H6P81_002538 [Aristolochia fimbriata]